MVRWKYKAQCQINHRSDIKMMRGFSLIESLVYLSLSMVLITLFVTVLSSFYNNSKLHNQRTSRYLDMVIGFDHLLDDLKNASSNKLSWKKISDDELIFCSSDFDSGWLIKSNRLIKYCGNFDSKKKNWSKKSMSLVMQQVHKIKFIVHRNKNQDILGIKCSIDGDNGNNNYHIDGFVALRRGFSI